MKKVKGFSVIELVVSISLIAIIGGITLYLMNPGGQLAKARDSQRRADLNTIMNGIRLNLADNRGTFDCAVGPLPTSTALRMASSGAGTYDIAECLVSTYLPIIPYDPAAPGAHYSGTSNYDSGYFVQQNSTTKQVTLSAPSAENTSTISITR